MEMNSLQSPLYVPSWDPHPCSCLERGCILHHTEALAPPPHITEASIIPGALNKLPSTQSFSLFWVRGSGKWMCTAAAKLCPILFDTKVACGWTVSFGIWKAPSPIRCFDAVLSQLLILCVQKLWLFQKQEGWLQNEDPPQTLLGF